MDLIKIVLGAGWCLTSDLVSEILEICEIEKT